MKTGLTQEQLAKRIGVSQVYICKLENGGVGGLTVDKLNKLSKALHICPSELLSILLKYECSSKCLLIRRENNIGVYTTHKDKGQFLSDYNFLQG